MGVFSFAVKENSVGLNKREPPKNDNIFKYIWDIYDIIREGGLDYKEKLNNVLKNIDQSKYGFIVWVLNHCLVYNKFTRDNLELFTLVSNTFLSNEEYIYFYVDYMIKNNVQFPKFMPWYKLGIEQEDKKYKEIIKEEFKLNDDELEDALEYLRNENVSIRDICLSILN